MKILTTNASGKDLFGGIHTHLEEYIKNSPQHNFFIVEPNKERKYISRKNRRILKLDTPSLVGSDDILDILKKSESLPELDKNSEKIINEYQNFIQSSGPDKILIFGSSLASYFLSEASKREGSLEKVVHIYSGVLEKEIGEYNWKTRELLRSVGRSFTSGEALNNIFYIFPSNLCKRTVEEIHEIKIKNFSVIPNGVSKEFSEKRLKRRPPEKLSLGYIGRLLHVKNPDFFLNLRENLAGELSLKIITDLNSIANKPTGQSLLKKMTSGEILYFHPRSRKELCSFYKTELSATIIPSFFETFCNVAVESIVCGTPGLLSDKAGAKEIFEKYGLKNLIFSIDHTDSFNSALDTAKKMNFQIDERISREMYHELSWKKVITRYNSILESGT